MKVPRLYLFDLEGLVERINSSLAEDEGEIERGFFEDKTPKNALSLLRSEGRIVDSIGEYPLIQTVQGVLLTESETDIGYIHIERGVVLECDGIYEMLRLKTRKPLNFKDGKILPKCKVRILLESLPFVGDYDYMLREDFTKEFKFFFGLFWAKRDLSEILPTEWFSKGDARSYNGYGKKESA